MSFNFFDLFSFFHFKYTFQWGVAFAQLPELLKGAVITFELGLLPFWGGALIGLLGAALKTFRGALPAPAPVGERLCRLLHQHAGADPDIFSSLWPAGHRHCLGQIHLHADR